MFTTFILLVSCIVQLAYIILGMFQGFILHQANLFFQGNLCLPLTPKKLTAGHASQKLDFFFGWSS